MLTSTAPADVAYYLHGANEFVDILRRSCVEAGRDPNSIGDMLEVGCGYGRIVRELRKRMPSARVYVSDVIDEAAQFTAAEFGAHYMPPLEKAGAEFGGRFDLVYLLSVYSHLRRDIAAANLRRVAAVLKPGGVAVMTLQGQGSADTVERYKLYWLDKNRLLQALDARRLLLRKISLLLCGLRHDVVHPTGVRPARSRDHTRTVRDILSSEGILTATRTCSSIARALSSLYRDATADAPPAAWASRIGPRIISPTVAIAPQV